MDKKKIQKYEIRERERELNGEEKEEEDLRERIRRKRIT